MANASPRQKSIVVVGHDAGMASALAALDPRLQPATHLRDYRAGPPASVHRASGMLLTDRASLADATPATLDLVRGYVERGGPVLASGRGARVLNAACGDAGAPDIASSLDADARTEPADRTSLFLTVGSKLASTIGGSGWVTLRNAQLREVPLATLAPGLMPAAITEDSAVAAFEAPGHAWVIGAGWDIAAAAGLPSGFGSLFEAFLDRTIG